MVITLQSSSSNAARDRVREAANAAIIGARNVNNGMLNPPPKILPLIVRSSCLGIDMSGWIEPGRVNEHTELNLWLGAQTHNTSIILLTRGVDGLTTNLSAGWRQFLERWVPAFLGLKFVFQYSSVAVDPASVARILPGPRQRGRILQRCALQEILTLGVDPDAAELLQIFRHLGLAKTNHTDEYVRGRNFLPLRIFHVLSRSDVISQE